MSINCCGVGTMWILVSTQDMSEQVVECDFF